MRQRQSVLWHRTVPKTPKTETFFRTLCANCFSAVTELEKHSADRRLAFWHYLPPPPSPLHVSFQISVHLNVTVAHQFGKIWSLTIWLRNCFLIQVSLTNYSSRQLKGGAVQSTRHLLRLLHASCSCWRVLACSRSHVSSDVAIPHYTETHFHVKLVHFLLHDLYVSFPVNAD